MKTFCEIVASEFLPAVRALITKELVTTYRMTQKEVAKRMQITQPAVSYYARELRGVKIKLLQANGNIMTFVKEMSASIANGNSRPIEIHDLCARLRSENICNESSCEKCSICKK